MEYSHRKQTWWVQLSETQPNTNLFRPKELWEQLLLTVIRFWLILSLYYNIQIKVHQVVHNKPSELLATTVFSFYAVVVWSDLLGDLQYSQDTLSWHPPNISDCSAGEWREAPKTKQCCLLWFNVSKFSMFKSYYWWKLILPMGCCAHCSCQAGL